MHQSFVTTASPKPLSRAGIVMVLPASCPHSVVVKYYGELQTQNESPRHSLGLGGGGGQWSQMTSA